MICPVHISPGCLIHQSTIFTVPTKISRRTGIMDRVFSVDEISDQFWSPPITTGIHDSSTMNRSASEWAFQRFLQEASVPSPTSAPPSSSSSFPPHPNNDVSLPVNGVKEQPKHDPSGNVNIKASPIHNDGPVLTNGPPPPPTPNIPVDSEEYQAFLKSKLNLACAAVAFSRVILFLLLSRLLEEFGT